MSVIIQPFQAEDTVSIIHLFREAVHTTGARYYSSEQVAAWAPLDGITDAEVDRWRYKFQEHITLVAYIDEAIVGFADMAKGGYIDHVYVHPKHQAKGVAYLLFKKLESIAKELGFIQLTTHASVNAMPLAVRVGFTIVKKETICYRGVLIDRYEMEKAL